MLCSIQQGDTTAALRFGAALWPYWRSQGRATQGGELLAELLALVEENSRASKRGALERRLSQVAVSMFWLLGVAAFWLLWRHLQLLAFFIGLWLLFVAAHHPAVRRWDAYADVLYGAGVLALDRGEKDAALPLLTSSLETWQGRQRPMANVLIALGHLHRQREEFNASRACFERALTLARQRRWRAEVSSALAGLGLLHHDAAVDGELGAADTGMHPSNTSHRDEA